MIDIQQYLCPYMPFSSKADHHLLPDQKILNWKPVLNWKKLTVTLCETNEGDFTFVLESWHTRSSLSKRGQRIP
jgi:hypothetical protein